MFCLKQTAKLSLILAHKQTTLKFCIAAIQKQLDCVNLLVGKKLSNNNFMTETFLNWLRALIASGDVHPFYCTSQWVGLSHRVLDMDQHECQICKQRGRYKRAELVHHVNHVKDAPDKALDIWYRDADGKEQRNLISVCKDCHETVCHPERLHKSAHAPPLTRERWD